MSTTVSMTYTGPGGENWDVAEETGGTAQMKPGETYEVSEELAKRLMLGGGWKAPSGKADELAPGPDATDGAKAKARELGVDLNSVEGTGSEGKIIVKDVENAASEASGDGEGA